MQRALFASGLIAPLRGRLPAHELCILEMHVAQNKRRRRSGQRDQQTYRANETTPAVALCARMRQSDSGDCVLRDRIRRRRARTRPRRRRLLARDNVPKRAVSSRSVI